MKIDELIEAASLLGMDYEAWKQAEKNKNHARDTFFRLATESLASRQLEQVVISYAEDEVALHDEVERKFPGWYMKEYNRVDDHYEIKLQENPELAKFSFVNPIDGKVYSRQISTGVMMLDDERIQTEDPELWEKVSYIPQERKLKPVEELTSEQLAALQKYTYMTKPTPKLGPPRTATEEELAEQQYELGVT